MTYPKRRIILAAINELKNQYILGTYKGGAQNCPLCKATGHSKGNGCKICPWVTIEGKTCTAAGYMAQTVNQRIARCNKWISIYSLASDKKIADKPSVKRFSNAKVGDAVFTDEHGPGKIISIKGCGDDYPIKVLFSTCKQETFTLEGKYYSESFSATLFYINGENNKSEVRAFDKPDYSTFKVDDKIYVTDRESTFNSRNIANASRRYFAKVGEESGILAFNNGATSFSNEDESRFVHWAFAWKAEE